MTSLPKRNFKKIFNYFFYNYYKKNMKKLFLNLNWCFKKPPARLLNSAYRRLQRVKC